MQRIIGVCGFKNSGKTTLVEKLVSHLTEMGFRVSTIKHAHHDFDIDHEGRDSFRHRKAGATEVAVISQQRWAIMHELRKDEPPTLDEVLCKLEPCDLVIVEGYKRDTHDKIEVRNLELKHPELAGDDATIVAIAANGKVNSTVPVFDRDDVSALAKFLEQHCQLNSMKSLIRRARKADAAAVRQLTRDVYAKWIPIIGREPMPMEADYEKAVEDHWIDLLEHDGSLVAVVEMVPQATHLFIENLAVAEAEQGKGLASLLLNHAEQIARSAGLLEVQLATNQAFADNVVFYQKRGYEIYETKPFARGGIGVRFRKSLS